ncbi:MAG: sulfite exporter TauE/SafE family protein, partial [Flavobacteriales bacterium]|nr:sulfite exporter TauE/SafE family protein [Flavobacteriales bacterium]
SISGLAASSQLPFDLDPQLYILMPITIIGGIAGAYFGAHRFNIKLLKYLLAVVLLIASTKFLFA